MKKSKGFMSAALICFFYIFAFKFGPEGIKWFWSGQEMVPIILGVSTIIFGSFWSYYFLKNRVFNNE
jgi:hypothetical protein